MRIDLHTHSTASDGTQTPSELVRQAAAMSLDVLALTDHDTTAGWAEAAALAPQAGVALVRGAELTCVRGNVTVHVLAYLFDPEHPSLARGVGVAQDSRWGRVERIVASLATEVDITLDDVRRHVPVGAAPGRPHVADALVAAGHVPDRTQAFARFLGDDSPHYQPHVAMDPADACRWVAAAGGVTVLAHPLTPTRGALPSPEMVEDMAAAGLWGLERDHPEHDAEARDEVTQLAQRLSLVCTGGSDYHGTGKPQPLGSCLSAPEAYAELVSRATGMPVVS